jgi:hypothetical protein
MTEQRWRSVALALATVLAVLVAIVFVTGGPGGSSAGATPSPTVALTTPSGGASPSTTASSGPSTGPSASASASPSASASTSASPSAGATPAPTAGLAQITLTDVRLDARSDPGGLARTFTFVTDGPTKVTAKLTAKSPQGTTRFCLIVGKSQPFCRNWSSGTLTGITSSKGGTTFKVTLIGVGIATPLVDLGLTFRAKAPSVAVTNARFDGTAPAADGYNGLSGRVKIRPGGILAVKADWGITPFSYTYSLVDLTAPSAGGVFPGTATGIDRSDPATAGDSYAFSLVNDETGSGRTPMTMTIAWK